MHLRCFFVVFFLFFAWQLGNVWIFHFNNWKISDFRPLDKFVSLRPCFLVHWVTYQIFLSPYPIESKDGKRCYSLRSELIENVSVFVQYWSERIPKVSVSILDSVFSGISFSFVVSFTNKIYKQNCTVQLYLFLFFRLAA